MGCEPARGLNEFTSALAVSPDGGNVYLAGGDSTNSNVPELVISPDGLSAYAIFLTPTLAGGVGAYRRDPSTGALIELPGQRGCLSTGGRGGCATARAIEDPQSVTMSADGRNVYVSAFNSHAIAVFGRRRGGTALRQRRGTAGCISRDLGPAIPGPLGGIVNVDEGCASGAIEGTDFELSRDGVWGYSPEPDAISIVARNAPRIRTRIRPRRCLTASTTASIAVRAYARLRGVTVRLDRRLLVESRRRRIRVRIPRAVHQRRTLSVVAVDARGRRGHVRRTLRNCQQ